MRGLWRIKEFVHQLKSACEKTILIFPKIVECNICGWNGRNFFSDSWHLHVVCPSCRSQVRHRLLVAALSHIEQLSYQNIIQNKSVLHFAPENMLKPILRKDAGYYVTADLTKDNVDITLDILSMSQIKENSFDIVIACDVLEHVENDTQAIREICRILSPGGMQF